MRPYEIISHPKRYSKLSQQKIWKEINEINKTQKMDTKTHKKDTNESINKKQRNLNTE